MKPAYDALDVKQIEEILEVFLKTRNGFRKLLVKLLLVLSLFATVNLTSVYIKHVQIYLNDCTSLLK